MASIEGIIGNGLKSPIRIQKLQVTGDLTPNATGLYSKIGIHNNKWYYQRTDMAYYLYWAVWGIWVINHALGGPVVKWEQDSVTPDDPTGTFVPFTALGTATVIRV